MLHANVIAGLHLMSWWQNDTVKSFRNLTLLLSKSLATVPIVLYISKAIPTNVWKRTSRFVKPRVMIKSHSTQIDSVKCKEAQAWDKNS